MFYGVRMRSNSNILYRYNPENIIRHMAVRLSTCVHIRVFTRHVIITFQREHISINGVGVRVLYPFGPTSDVCARHKTSHFISRIPRARRGTLAIRILMYMS